MSSTTDRLTPPVSLGVVSAAIGLGIALALGIVPALVLQLSGQTSSMTVLEAILLGISVTVLGHGGSLALSTGMLEGAFTLTPLGLTLLLIAVGTLSLRRTGRRLELLTADGALRDGALRDAGLALGTYVVAYSGGMGLISALAGGATSSPVTLSAVVSGVMVALLGGIAGLVASLRRPAFGNRPAVRTLDLLPAAARPLYRSVTVTLLGLAASGLLVTAALWFTHLGAMQEITARLDPGPAGLVLLLLLHLALLPTFALWTLAVLLGGAVTLGTGTSISLGGFDAGVLPLLPALGALPEPGTFPGAARLLLLLPLAVICLGAVPLVRGTRALPSQQRWLLRLAHPLLVTVAVLVALGLSAGGIGSGRLASLGPVMQQVAPPLLGLALLGTALIVVALDTPVRAYVTEALTALRSGVEREEGREEGERVGGSVVARSASEESAAASAGEQSAHEEPRAPEESAEGDEHAEDRQSPSS